MIGTFSAELSHELVDLFLEHLGYGFPKLDLGAIEANRIFDLQCFPNRVGFSKKELEKLTLEFRAGNGKDKVETRLYWYGSPKMLPNDIEIKPPVDAALAREQWDFFVENIYDWVFLKNVSGFRQVVQKVVQLEMQDSFFFT